jgi:8-oxo-dGTP pyrophosphatase MutT (NUDIX family)
VIERLAARVVLLDPAGRVLLLRGSDPARPEDGDWWITPGGGVEPGESLEQAARREVQEETGYLLPADLGPIVLHRTIRFSFDGLEYEQTEHFYLATVEHSRVDYSGWTEVERRSMQTHRWWTVQELRSTTEAFYPERLPDLLSSRRADPNTLTEGLS